MRRILPFVVLALSGAASCAAPPSDAPAPPAESASTAEPWSLADVEIDRADGLSVLVLHDMEGLSGQDDPRTFSFRHSEYYARGQEMLAADINAVVEGLFAGGATEVHVVDGHGSGNPDPDLRADLLDSRASQIFRDEPFDTYFDIPETAHYDAVAVVGMHAKTGSHGFASHTFTLGIELQVNGQPITETELVGLSWGRFDVPVIFASGDDRLAADLQTMPWIESVTVKTATSASTVELRSVDEARADLTAAARRAVENIDNAQIMQVSLPVRGTVRTVAPASLASLSGVPGIDYAAADDAQSVSFEVADLRQMYDGMVALVGVARAGYPSVLFEQLRGLGLADQVLPAYSDALTARWLDVESDRWSAPEPPPGGLTRGHGYR